MKLYLKFICVVAFMIGTAIFYSFGESTPPQNEKDQLLIEALRFILEKGHYDPKIINDKFSENIFDHYIENLDPYKRYFLTSDISYFKKYYHDIDNQIFRRKLDFFNLVTNTFEKRVKSIEQLYKPLLAHPFNYNKDETINLGSESSVFPNSTDDQKDIWRKHLKFSTISRLDLLLKEQEAKQKEDPTYKSKLFSELEKEAREKTQKNLEDLFYYENKSTRDERFASFLNIVTSEFDPHTNYFAPEIQKRFEAGMSGSIEGIGARLQDERGYTKVIELIAGGPAYKQGDLEVGDYILKVTQTDQEAKDIVGMRLTDAIELIKGKKGTTVTLTVKKVDNTIQKISIVRDIVEFEETFVKSSIVKSGQKRFAIINLPKFYIDFTDSKSRNAATDMAREIKELKKESIQGIVLDLRNNGGGSLSTAIDIAGLFIEKGPVVQVKDRSKKPSVREDKDSAVLWKGPLVILVNQLSASASEILAAAMQDYKRAIIIGSEQTYGKGTVQNIIPINRYLNYPEDLGALKLTIQKFYRINGGSTQLKGVSSDVIVPNRYSYLDISEKNNETPLDWDMVEKANYRETYTYVNYDRVINNAQKRVSESQTFKNIDSYAKWLKSNQDDLTYSLNLKEFQKNENENAAKAEEYKDNLSFSSIYHFIAPKYEQYAFVRDTILKSKRKTWHKKLKEDIYISEAVQTLNQLKLVEY